MADITDPTDPDRVAGSQIERRARPAALIAPSPTTSAAMTPAQELAEASAYRSANYDELERTGNINGVDAYIELLEQHAGTQDRGSGRALRDHFNTMGTSSISFEQAAGAGVELVHHFDSDRRPIFHTFDGDVVYRNSESGRWEVSEGARNGVTVWSGDTMRVHQPNVADSALIADTAHVDPSATIEPGARVGPHAVVGPHAHVGKDSSIASYGRVEAGAFVGAFCAVKDGSRIGPGAVVGAGSRIGPTANIGAGARLEQRTSIEAFDNVAAHSRTGTVPQKHERGAGLHPGQVSYLVDRLAALDRDG